MSWLFRLLRRVLMWAGVIVVLLGAGVAAAYYSGVKMPVYADTSAVIFPNWNKTRTVEANLLHDSIVWREDGRVHLDVKLQMPEAIHRLQSFLDGGRSEIVACGPQRLLLHSLVDGQVGIDDDVVTVDGMVDMELDGLIKVRDDLPLSTAIRVSHDRTSVSAEIIRLSIGQIPEQMIEVLLEQKSRFSYSRDQIFEMVANGLPPEDAALLSTHSAALDLAFETVKPAQTGESFHLEAVISVREAAALQLLGDRLVDATTNRTQAIAAILGPNRAHAQFLKDLTKQLEKAGKKLGKEIEKELEKTVPGAGKLLEDPAAAAETILNSFSDCKVSF